MTFYHRAHRRPTDIRALPLKSGARVHFLASRPADFDVVAVTMRHYLWSGAELRLDVLTSGHRDVADGFDGAATRLQKERIREAEQIESCKLFGLPRAALKFRNLSVDRHGNLMLVEKNVRVVEACLRSFSSDIVIIPHPSNLSVDRGVVYQLTEAAARAVGTKLTVMLANAPRTVAVRPDVFTPFSEQDAIWKGALLVSHRSQHLHSMHTWGCGFDTRILVPNRVWARGLGTAAPYAEVIQLADFEPFGA